VSRLFLFGVERDDPSNQSEIESQETIGLARLEQGLAELGASDRDG
jgi:hypothetical protein